MPSPRSSPATPRLRSQTTPYAFRSSWQRPAWDMHLPSNGLWTQIPDSVDVSADYPGYRLSDTTRVVRVTSSRGVHLWTGQPMTSSGQSAGWWTLFEDWFTGDGLARARASPMMALACASAATGIDFLLYSIIIPVFPFAIGMIDGSCPEGTENCEEDPQLGTLLGALIGVYSLMILLCAPFFGWLSDRLQTRRLIVLGGMLCLGASTIFFALARSIPLLFMARILQGISSAASWSLSMALVADVFPPEVLGRAMATMQVVFGLCQLGGPPLGGALYDTLGYHSVFIVSAALVCVNVVMWMIYIEKLPEAPPKDVGEPLVSKQQQTFKEVLRNPRVWVMLWMSVLTGLCITVFEPVLPPYAKDQFGLSSFSVGLVYLVCVFSGTVAAPFVGWARDKWGSKWMVLIGTPVLAVSFVSVGLPLSLGWIIAMLAIFGMITSIVSGPITPEFSMFCEPHLMGQSYAACEMGFAAGATIGPIMAGVLYSNFGLFSVGAVSGAVCLASVPALVWYYRAPPSNGGAGRETRCISS